MSKIHVPCAKYLNSHIEDRRSDEELVAAINGGDPDAFEVLYLRHRDWAVNLAFRFTSDRELALDVLQEAFLYLLKKFPNFTLRAKFTTFLYPVIRNLALNARKKNQRYELVDDKLEELTEPVEPDVEENLEEQLRVVMGNLPAQQQEVLLLRFVDDHSLNEIAEILDIPSGTVKSRLHNALRALAENPRTKNYFGKE